MPCHWVDVDVVLLELHLIYEVLLQVLRIPLDLLDSRLFPRATGSFVIVDRDIV